MGAVCEVCLWREQHSMLLIWPGAIAGAGKTTLMDCVAGRKTVGRITGQAQTVGCLCCNSPDWLAKKLAYSAAVRYLSWGQVLGTLQDLYHRICSECRADSSKPQVCGCLEAHCSVVP